uniref:Putative ovule protein n=1 Tax=Solanum chacoense TaxID=4108 RepID=A0A0V0HTL0_SOLCH
MYIHCETCTYWYHAEAVELEESKIFEVVGFKCCKCRRIKMPICPYLDPTSKEKRMCARASKMDRQGIDSGFISELQKDENMATPGLEDNKPLSAVEELTEHFPVGDCERNVETMSVPGQREQSVRSHIENETDLKSSELSTPLGGGNIVFPKDEMPTHVEPGAKQPVRRHVRLEKDSDTPFASDPLNVVRNTSRESSEEYGHGCKYMEFEPQTCFSFNELLASDDLGPLDGVDSSATLNKDVETSSRFLPNKNADTSYVEHEPAVSTIPTAAFAVPCKMCSRKEPCPDLCCETCEIWIHRHCSPWNDEESGEDDWKCGNCREWR